MVPVAENRPRVEAALRTGGNMDVTTVVIPSADHAFFPTTTGGRKDVAAMTLPGGRMRFAPGYLDAVTNWLKTRFLEQH